MDMELDYKSINRNSWNNKIDIHLESEFYDNESFLDGRNSLNKIELKLLGDLKGKSVLHLQCHFGQDSVSLARIGAKVTGVDISNKAIERAKELAQKTKSSAQFICCDIYDLPIHLDEKFDVVFTSYGTIGWLPNMDQWASVISTFLKPQGRFVFVEFHPVVWMFDDNFDNIKYKYSDTNPIFETEEGTYANKEVKEKFEFVMWNHGISEVINGLVKNGMEINSLDEFDYSPYNCFNNTIEIEPNKFRIKKMDDKIPMVYAIHATKKYNLL